MSKHKRRIAFVGTTRSGRDAPHGDPNWDFWGVSARADYIKKADKWFELHRLDGEPRAWADSWRGKLKVYCHDCELVMFYPEPDLASHVTRYPAERITKRFGSYFMTSTFAWMMALAIDEMCPVDGEWNPGEIGVYGVDMEYGTEYRQQRSGLRHFMYLAEALGIKITVLADGGLAYDPVPYPLWQDDPLTAKLTMRLERSKENIKYLSAGLETTRSLMAQNTAVLMEIDRFGGKDYSIESRIKELEEELSGLKKTSAETSKELVKSESTAEEQQWMLDYLAP